MLNENNIKIDFYNTKVLPDSSSVAITVSDFGTDSNVYSSKLQYQSVCNICSDNVNNTNTNSCISCHQDHNDPGIEPRG